MCCCSYDFVSPFSIFLPCISCLVVLVKSLESSGKQILLICGISDFFLKQHGEHSGFATPPHACSVFKMAFIKFRNAHFVPNMLRLFYHDKMLNFITGFF